MAKYTYENTNFKYYFYAHICIYFIKLNQPLKVIKKI